MPLPSAVTSSRIRDEADRQGRDGARPTSRRLDSCRGHACRPCFRRTAAQVEPPGHGQADRVEAEIDEECELRSAGHRNRFTEAARDEVAAAGTDRADEAN